MKKPKRLQSLKSWYADNFPADELGLELNPSATFDGLFDVLDCHGDVYDYMGVGDSVIRERLFWGLALYIDADYGYILDQWMRGA